MARSPKLNIGHGWLAKEVAVLLAVLGSCPALECAADAGSRVEANAAVMKRCDVAVSVDRSRASLVSATPCCLDIQPGQYSPELIQPLKIQPLNLVRPKNPVLPFLPTSAQKTNHHPAPAMNLSSESSSSFLGAYANAAGFCCTASLTISLLALPGRHSWRTYSSARPFCCTASLAISP